MTDLTQSTPSGSSPRTRREIRRAWERSELQPVSARPPFREYLQQLWDRRHFIRMHAYAQAVGQHQGTFLGNVWMILAPLLDGAVYWFIFGVVFNAAAGNPEFLPRLIVGVLLFSFVTRCWVSCANSVNSGRVLIRAFSFPRAALPVSAVVREVFSQVPGFLTMLVLVIAVPPHFYPNPLWLLSPLPILMAVGFVAGVGFMLARVVSIVPDLGKLIPYVVRLLLYLSGAIFPVARFSQPPQILRIITASPIFLFIDMTRSMVMYGVFPPQGQWALLFAWSVGTLILGLLFFWRGEVSYGRQRLS